MFAGDCSNMKCLGDTVKSYMNDGHFSFSVTGKLFSALPPDQIIEIEMNSGSKPKAGWIKFTHNSYMVNTHNSNVNKINAIRDYMLSFFW